MDEGIGESEMKELVSEWNEVVEEIKGVDPRDKNIPKEAISDFRKDDVDRWPSKSNDGWRASTMKTLNRDEVKKVWGFGNCENFAPQVREMTRACIRCVQWFWGSGESVGWEWSISQDLRALQTDSQYEQESSGSAGDGIIDTQGVYSRENCSPLNILSTGL